MYYVKFATRGETSAKGGSPRQAVNYITDGHDFRRDPGYADAELAYIARLGAGWKAELEGGRVPLVGYGDLATAAETEMPQLFEAACSPPAAGARGRAGKVGKAGAYRPGATRGYISYTFTLPKEISLYAEGHRAKAQTAMHAAISAALEQAYPGKHIAAVGAIHTRNEAGEIHYHAHVLVAKFASEKATGRVVSLNGRRGGGHDRSQLPRLKAAWKDAVDRELKERLGLGIEQRTPNAAPTLVLPDGTRLPPLNRESRRVLEKEVAPWYAVPAGGGRVGLQRQLRLTALDDRIFEIASGARGAGGWSLDEFVRLFPDQAHAVARHEKRAETLRQIGYLTPEGKVTREFRVHFAVRHGVETPELQRLRIDIANRAAREARHATPATRRPPVPAIWEALDRYDFVRRRAERLGLSREDLRKIEAEANRNRPTRQRLEELRAQVERHVGVAPPRALPETKGIIRAFVGVQAMRVQRLYLLTESIATLGLRYRRNSDLADRIRKSAERDLFYAKEKRLAQLGRGLRPIFWAVRIALPHRARRIEKAIERCARLAYHQEVRRVHRQEVTRAYKEWRARFIDGPRADLRRQAEALALPGQAPERQRVARAAKQVKITDLAETVRLFEVGREVLERLRPQDAARLRGWRGREEMLITEVVAAAYGEARTLKNDEREAAIRAGRIGHLLDQERRPAPLEVPDGMERDRAAILRADARLRAFGIESPFRGSLDAVAPDTARAAVRIFDRAGLLGDGPEWTLAAGPARRAAGTAAELLDRDRADERLLLERLGGRDMP